MGMNLETESADLLVLGIDGGGTKTVALLARADVRGESGVIGRGFSGPSNQRAVGPVVAMSNLDAAVETAFSDAHLDRRTVDAACLGLAGADRESDRRIVERWAEEARLAHRVIVVNDAIPLLHAGSARGCGVALIAGTGSLAFGRNATGQSARSGGWGYLFGDEGSAFAIGRAVLQAVTRAADGRAPATRLLDDVLRQLAVSSASDIVTAVYSHEVPRAVIAGLAPRAFDAAASADHIAAEIVDLAATELAAMVVAVADRLELRQELHLILSGSVLLQQASFREQVAKRISISGVDLQSTTIVQDAVAGAVEIARSLLLPGAPRT